MVKMIEVTDPIYGTRIALNASLILSVEPHDSKNLNNGTWIAMLGRKEVLHIAEGYHEVLDKIYKAEMEDE